MNNGLYLIILLGFAIAFFVLTIYFIKENR